MDEQTLAARLATLETQIVALFQRLNEGFGGLKESMDDHRETAKLQADKLEKLEERTRMLEVASEVGKMKFMLLAGVGSAAMSVLSSVAVWFLTR